ncbi:hypothetical protein Dimus_020268, partial [Dionaea muscipula]
GIWPRGSGGLHHLGRPIGLEDSSQIQLRRHRPLIFHIQIFHRQGEGELHRRREYHTTDHSCPSPPVRRLHDLARSSRAAARAIPPPRISIAPSHEPPPSLVAAGRKLSPPVRHHQGDQIQTVVDLPRHTLHSAVRQPLTTASQAFTSIDHHRAASAQGQPLGRRSPATALYQEATGLRFR